MSSSLPPSTRPRIRVVPEDFEVEEIPLETPRGEGQHLWLWVEKRLRNTDQVLDDLAHGLGVAPREVGYAGRKDHRAVTRQWMSVPAHVEEQCKALRLPQAEILRAERHPHRLRLGELAGNRFRLRVQQVDAATADGLPQRLAGLVERGMPNRFGPQRFGRDGRNADRGAEMLRRGRLKGPRRKAMLMLSALQSRVFNRVLEQRGEAYDRLIPGDLVRWHASGELQLIDDPTAYGQQCLDGELSATGPIFGSKMRWPRGDVMAAEERAMEELDLPPLRRLDLPRGLKLYGDRRPLRVPLKDLTHQLNSETLELGFVLPPGSYATVLLEALLPGGYGEGPDPESAAQSEEGSDLTGADKGADDAAEPRQDETQKDPQ